MIKKAIASSTDLYDSVESVSNLIRDFRGERKGHIFVFVVRTFGFSLHTPEIIKTSTVYWQLHIRGEFIMGVVFDNSKKKRVLNNMLKALE